MIKNRKITSNLCNNQRLNCYLMECILTQDAPLAAESDLHKFTGFKYPHLSITADFMVDVIPYKFVPYLGPFQGFNWESVTHIMPLSQLKIGETYHRSSVSKIRKPNENSDTNIDEKSENIQYQTSRTEAIKKFKKECVWWGWSILDPSQLGTLFSIF